MKQAPIIHNSLFIPHGFSLPRNVSAARAFTLIELLISLGIIAALTGLSITIINPVEMLRKGRDTQRIQELTSLKDALLLYQGEYSSTPLAPSTTTVYLSLPDTNANCSSYSLPSLPGGYSYACKPESTYRKVDGTGWIPVNLTNLSQTIGSTPLSTLPKDPVNNTPTSYLTFTVNGSNQFELNASLEAQTNTTLMVSDVGDNDLSYETGTNLTIYPIAGYQLAKTDGDNQPIYSQSDLLYAAGTSPYLPYFTDGTHLGNTGIYWNNTTSRLGVNTATPAQALDVTGNINFTGSLSGGTVPYTLLASFPSACTSGQYVTAIGATLTCSTPSSLPAGTTGQTLVNSTSTTYVATSTIFLSGGNVGIGTTSPGRKLDILDGSVGIGMGTYGSAFRLVGWNGSVYNDLLLDVGGNNNLYLKSSTGNVGIGTTTPASLLHAYKGNPGTMSPYYTNVIRADNSADAGIALGTPTANAAYIYHHTPLDGASAGIKFDGTGRYMSFFTVNGAERMRIDNVGNVGIGTTTPAAKMHVNGDLKVEGSRIIRKISVQTDSTIRSFNTAWGLGATFSTITGFKAGSLVKLTYHVPMRNDSGSWGGGYVEPQISFNGGSTWNSLGSSGYDGGVMNSGGAAIGSYFNSILIDPAQAADFSVTVRFYHKSYDGIVEVNSSHDINGISGTATLMTGVNGQQHFTKIIVEELY